MEYKSQGLIKLKKKRTIKKFDNVVVFPGTSEMLLQDAQFYAENFQYELAVEKFEAAFKITEGNEHTLLIFAFALYELKRFEKAKIICEQLLQLSPSNYFEAMELYLTVCMQLKQFESVNKMIQSLLEEGLVPENRIDNFERLKNLNAEIAANKKLQEEMQYEGNIGFSIDSFIELPPQQQLVILNELSSQNIRPISEDIKQVIERKETHTFIKSLLLILLVEQAVSMEIKLEKFGQYMNVNPQNFPLPTQLPMYQEVMDLVLVNLEKEPTTQELVQHLVTKHAIVAYPFGWQLYTAEEVASGYLDFVKMMFGELDESGEASIELLKELEHLSEF